MKKFNKPKNLILLNLSCFKIKICLKTKEHNLKTCCFYHNNNDKRRDLKIMFYKNVLCKNKNKCEKGENCSYSHNMNEYLYHPNNFKKILCFKYFYKGKCNYKKFCSFSHSMEELRINLIHKLKQNYIFFLFFYKTEFCPWGKIPHDLNLCVYSHNFQDYKRKFLFKKFPVICKNWDIKKDYNDYEEGCKKGIECKYLHGWKEFSFHPIYYKKNRCKTFNKNCLNKLICKNLHGPEKKYKNKKIFMPNHHTMF